MINREVLLLCYQIFLRCHQGCHEKSRSTSFVQSIVSKVSPRMSEEIEKCFFCATNCVSPRFVRISSRQWPQ
jgi:hypothetical protein